MHGYNAIDLGRSFRTVRKNTIQIAEEIPEEQYSFRAADGCRSVAETLRHIAVSTGWPIQVHGQGTSYLTFALFMEVHAQQAKAEAALQTKADILQALHDNGEKFAAFLEGLSGEVLAQQVSYPPEAQQAPKTRFEMLLSAKEHEMHHRAQLMVAERMIGIKPHLTRAMEERMASVMAQPKAAAGA